MTIKKNEGYRIAYAISFLFHPFIIVVPLFFIVSLRFAIHPLEGVLWGSLVSLGVSAAPFALIRRGVAQGRLTDYDVSRREQRLLPFLYTLICMGAALALLIVFDAAIQVLAVFIGMVCAVASALLVTHLARWKISLHLIGITGAVLTLSLLVTPSASWLSPLIVLVGWARWRVGAHTAWQAITGAVLAAAVTGAIYRLFGL
ncbi:hypothetical protein [Cohnella boryungensis]|uniref:PAP2 superfamily protein n=1 Tax=Cohnella boryungensis TaxID=768479 RepID=A0ABV8SIW5_9BACL